MDLHKLIQPAVDTWINFIHYKGATVRLELAAESTTCEIAPYAFREILSVLLVNSVQAHAKVIRFRSFNDVKLHVSPECFLLKAVCLECIDDGIGWQPTTRSRSSKHPTRPSTRGSGQALACS